MTHSLMAFFKESGSVHLDPDPLLEPCRCDSTRGCQKFLERGVARQLCALRESPVETQTLALAVFLVAASFKP